MSQRKQRYGDPLLNFRLPADEHVILKRHAAEKGTTVSELVRSVVRREFLDRGRDGERTEGLLMKT